MSDLEALRARRAELQREVDALPALVRDILAGLDAQRAIEIIDSAIDREVQLERRRIAGVP